MPRWIRHMFHRHTWRVLKTMYRYPDPRYSKMQVEVKKCQCRDCGRIEYVHFSGKDIVY